jgi:hypothetical protein
MAESRNITWLIKFKVEPHIKHPYVFKLVAAHLNYGKWMLNPPAQITAHPGKEAEFGAAACGAAWTATGVEGGFRYVCPDGKGDAELNFSFDIPYSSANKGRAEIIGVDALLFEFDSGGDIHSSGNSQFKTVTIRQIKDKA